MAFTVHAPDARDDGGSVSENFGNDASYELHQTGALIVKDGRGKQLTYGPGSWWLIEEDEPPKRPAVRPACSPSRSRYRCRWQQGDCPALRVGQQRRQEGIEACSPTLTGVEREAEVTKALPAAKLGLGVTGMLDRTTPSLFGNTGTK